MAACMFRLHPLYHPFPPSLPFNYGNICLRSHHPHQTQLTSTHTHCISTLSSLGSSLKDRRITNARVSYGRFLLGQQRSLAKWVTIPVGQCRAACSDSKDHTFSVRNHNDGHEDGYGNDFAKWVIIPVGWGRGACSGRKNHTFVARNHSDSHEDGHDHDHGHEHEHHHHHHHEDEHRSCVGEAAHGHAHQGHGNSGGLNRLQLVIIKTSAWLGLARLADAWRDNLHVCCFSLGLLVLAVFAPHVLPAKLASPLQSGLVAVAFPLTGVPALLDASIDIAAGRVNIHVLMALAAFASMFMGNILEGALLLAMFSLSHQAEEYFTKRALGDVKALKESNPEFALVLDTFDISSPPPLSSITYKKVAVSEVEAGSYLLVKAGETVPVDGEVWQGRSMVTVEHLTGEAHPVEKHIGASVPGGARSLDGLMIIKATKKWQDSTLARIMKLAEEAQLNRPKLQRWLDEFGEHYSRIVVVASLAVAVVGPLLFKWPFMSNAGTRGSIYRALGLMVAASPCALAVTPLAYATAISACANKGILLKGGQALDALSMCNTVAFDKTGTLTTGKLVCKAIEPIYGHSQMLHNSSSPLCCDPTCEMEALAVAAAMEKGATHPIARALLDHTKGKKLPAFVIDNFESTPGKGLTALVSRPKEGSLPYKALLGSLEYILSSSTSVTDSLKIDEAAKASSYGREMVHAALSADQKVTLFHFEDKVRSGAAEVLNALKKQAGMQVIMLTGDHSDSATKIAEAVGIDVVYSGLKPEDKLDKVKNLSWHKENGHANGLVMVGDGINDAPALAAATVGIVLAQRASATAVAVADVLLIKDAIDGVPFVIAKAHQTTSLVKQNVALALISIFVAALSSISGILPLWITVLLHEGGTLLVCANSVRALSEPSLSRPLFQGSRGLRGLFSEAAKFLTKRFPTLIENMKLLPLSP